jgi:hypothetical protein
MSPRSSKPYRQSLSKPNQPPSASPSRTTIQFARARISGAHDDTHEHRARCAVRGATCTPPPFVFPLPPMARPCGAWLVNPLSENGTPTVDCFVTMRFVNHSIRISQLNLRTAYVGFVLCGMGCFLCVLLFISIAVRGGGPSHTRRVSFVRSLSKKQEGGSPAVGGFFLMAAITFPNETEASWSTPRGVRSRT